LIISFRKWFEISLLGGAKQRSPSPGNFYFGLRFILNIANLEVDSREMKMISKKYFCQKCGRELEADQKPCQFCCFINRDIKVASTS